MIRRILPGVMLALLCGLSQAWQAHAEEPATQPVELNIDAPILLALAPRLSALALASGDSGDGAARAMVGSP